MYERMLDKEHKPTEDEFVKYCGDTGVLFLNLNDYLINELKTESLMRFPYGKSYGWGMKYSIKSKLICDIFSEKDAFTVMLRLTDKQFEQEYDNLTDYTKEYIDKKYPCGGGGWVQYRVCEQRHLEDIEKLLSIKVRK